MPEYKVSRNSKGEIAMARETGDAIIWVPESDFSASIRDGLVPLSPDKANELHRRGSVVETGKAAGAGVLGATSLGGFDLLASKSSPEQSLELRRLKEEHGTAHGVGQVVGAAAVGAALPGGLVSAGLQGAALGGGAAVGDVATYGEEMAKGEALTHIVKGIGLGAATALAASLAGSGLSGIAKYASKSNLSKNIAMGALGYALGGPTGGAIGALAGEGAVARIMRRLGLGAGRALGRSVGRSVGEAASDVVTPMSNIAIKAARFLGRPTKAAAVISAIELNDISRSVDTANPGSIQFDSSIPSAAQEIVRQRTASALAEIKAALPVNPEPNRLGSMWTPSVKERMEFTHILNSVMDATYPLKRLSMDMATPREIAVLRSTAPEIHQQLQDWAKESIRDSKERGKSLTKKQAMNIFAVTGDSSLIPYEYSAKMLARLQSLRMPKQAGGQGRDLRVASGYQTMTQGINSRAQR